MGKIPWRREWLSTPVFLPGKSHRQRSLVGCSPWGHKESDTTEQPPLHFSLSCIGEGNGNPLQCSCLESPRDGGAWWATVYGIAQSWTRLKWPSSSSFRNVLYEKILSVEWLPGWGYHIYLLRNVFYKLIPEFEKMYLVHCSLKIHSLRLHL